MLNFSLTKIIRKNYQPNKILVKEIIQASLLKKYKQIYIDLTIVSKEESQESNLSFRNIDKPTNVIALEYADTRDNFLILNGEIILCDSIIVDEAKVQNKEILHHYIHMIVHAMLHLQGLDHIVDSERDVMEKNEIAILKRFAIENPYK